MPNLAGLPNGSQIDAESRAIRAWKRIQRDPTEVVILRKGVAQSAQTMRIEISNTGSSLQGNSDAQSSGLTGIQPLVLYGVIGHPSDDVPDTDLKHLDRAVINGKEYVFETIVTPPGEIQAFGRALK